MTRADRQEALSRAYLLAVAGYCGYTHSEPSKDYGIDLTLYDVSTDRRRVRQRGSRLDVQLKSTTAATLTRTAVEYDLDVTTYDDLREPTRDDRILVLLVLPADEADWLRQTESGLELRHAMYWVSLRGRPAVPNRRSVRVAIPRRYLFTADALRGIMERIRAGEPLT